MGSTLGLGGEVVLMCLAIISTVDQAQTVLTYFQLAVCCSWVVLVAASPTMRLRITYLCLLEYYSVVLPLKLNATKDGLRQESRQILPFPAIVPNASAPPYRSYWLIPLNQEQDQPNCWTSRRGRVFVSHSRSASPLFPTFLQ